MVTFANVYQGSQRDSFFLNLGQYEAAYTQLGCLFQFVHFWCFANKQDAKCFNGHVPPCNWSGWDLEITFPFLFLQRPIMIVISTWNQKRNLKMLHHFTECLNKTCAYLKMNRLKCFVTSVVYFKIILWLFRPFLSEIAHF